jgi:hypothetical protein
VDFLDLSPNDPDAFQDFNSQGNGAPGAAASASNALAANKAEGSTTNSSIPGFVFGTNLVFVLDPARLPPATGPLRIRYSNDNDGTSTSVPVDMGSHPIIVSTPVGNAPGDGHTITISAGASTTLGHFPPVEGEKGH